ncbi:hypothetical protein LTS18_008705, partial [Coniosporium uncinatum]
LSTPTKTAFDLFLDIGFNCLPMASPMMAFRGYYISRESDDPCASLNFHPAKDSDELHDSLRAAFPHVKTHKERMREAVIEFYLCERAQERRSESVGSGHGAGQPSVVSTPGQNSSPEYPSPESLLSNSFAVPSPAMDSQSSAGGSTPALSAMTSVWSISSKPQTKPRVRRSMTDAEKKEYRRRREAGACEDCRRRRRKCEHNSSGSESDRISTAAPKKQRRTVKETKRVASAKTVSPPTSAPQTVSTMTSFNVEMPLANDFSNPFLDTSFPLDDTLLASGDPMLDFPLFPELHDSFSNDFLFNDFPSNNFQSNNLLPSNGLFPTTFAGNHEPSHNQGLFNGTTQDMEIPGSGLVVQSHTSSPAISPTSQNVSPAELHRPDFKPAYYGRVQLPDLPHPGGDCGVILSPSIASGPSQTSATASLSLHQSQARTSQLPTGLLVARDRYNDGEDANIGDGPALRARPQGQTYRWTDAEQDQAMRHHAHPLATEAQQPEPLHSDSWLSSPLGSPSRKTGTVRLATSSAATVTARTSPSGAHMLVDSDNLDDGRTASSSPTVAQTDRITRDMQWIRSPSRDADGVSATGVPTAAAAVQHDSSEGATRNHNENVGLRYLPARATGTSANAATSHRPSSLAADHLTATDSAGPVVVDTTNGCGQYNKERSWKQQQALSAQSESLLSIPSEPLGDALATSPTGFGHASASRVSMLLTAVLLALLAAVGVAVMNLFLLSSRSAGLLSVSALASCLRIEADRKRAHASEEGKSGPVKRTAMLLKEKLADAFLLTAEVSYKYVVASFG